MSAVPATIEDSLKKLRATLPVGHHSPGIQNVNQVHDDTLSVGQHVADGVARNMGSWRFIIIQSTILVFWIVLNAIQLIFKPFDPYPFILLNLALSFQAAYAAPIIMMSQNRQADKDRLAAEHDYCVNIRSDARVHAVLEHLKAQDDVILTILRQLESVHHIVPDAEQMAAERHLLEARDREGEMLENLIREEERAAGLPVLEDDYPSTNPSA